MLSKRSIILDSLSTHRIDEGVIDSISKNSSSGSGARGCNRIEKFLFDKMGVGYCYIWKDGKSKIKLS